VLVATVVACGTISRTPPEPTPADFPGIASAMTLGGISISNIVSGDAGCPDADLAKTAIGFDASGLDQPGPVRIHLYIFRNRDVYERERSRIDACARSFVSDPSTFESVESSPFVAAGQGPWGSAFRDRFRSVLETAAGTGG
jgi:hypothetical protein